MPTVVVACEVARVKEWMAGVILSWKFMLVSLSALGYLSLPWSAPSSTKHELECAKALPPAKEGSCTSGTIVDWDKASVGDKCADMDGTFVIDSHEMS